MKKVFKIIGICLISIIIIALAYVSYVFISYYRIEDNLELDIENNQTTNFDISKTYTVSTYNIGFGAYEQNYSFFMDEGEMLDGTKTRGKHARGLSKDNVINNVNGAINTIIDLNTDFAFFQEVDLKSSRSYKVNQADMIKDKFENYASTFAINYDSPYLMYPFNEPIGKSKSGILTLSKYKIEDSLRISFPLTGNTMSDLFDLDRCMMIDRIKVSEDKELVLINLHMSAYDEGGKVRQKQMEVLNKVLEKEMNNYVIVGGDFNQRLCETNFPTTQKVGPWCQDFYTELLNSNYHIACASNTSTCRCADLEYEKGVNYELVIDGFLIGPNVELVSITNIDTDYKYSDHNPVKMEFRLLP